MRRNVRQLAAHGDRDCERVGAPAAFLCPDGHVGADAHIVPRTHRTGCCPRRLPMARATARAGPSHPAPDNYPPPGSK
jgi:hypothetical protein